MTTIAYDLKRRTIATDGRITAADEIITDDACKMHDRGGIMFFMAGSVADVDQVANAFIACSHRVRKTLDVEGLAWTGSKLFELAASGGDLSWHPVVADHGAIGSGAGYAVTAMDSGATPRQAVAAAAKRNCKTGGKIKVYRLESIA